MFSIDSNTLFSGSLLERREEFKKNINDPDRTIITRPSDYPTSWLFDFSMRLGSGEIIKGNMVAKNDHRVLVVRVQKQLFDV